MNATQKARRVDALNIDHINRRELCVMVANREAENEDLRELVADLYHQLLNAYDAKELDAYWRRMRRLKVKVDE